MSLKAADFNSDAAYSYLSAHDGEAKKSLERLRELDKTRHEDEKEWSRANRIKQAKAEFDGKDRPALLKSLQELEALQRVLDGKAEPAGEERKGDFLGSLRKLLGGK
jgi:hypothetical protein